MYEPSPSPGAQYAPGLMSLAWLEDEDKIVVLVVAVLVVTVLVVTVLVVAVTAGTASGTVSGTAIATGAALQLAIVSDAQSLANKLLIRPNSL